MKQEQLLQALGGIDPAYIDDAAPGSRTQRHPVLAGVLSAAACLVLAAMLTVLWSVRQRQQNAATNDPLAQTSEGVQQGEDTEKTDIPDTPRMDESAVNASRDEILAYQFGDLRLGMPQAKVLELLGEPADVSKGSGIRSEDGIWRSTWFYNLSSNMERIYDLSVSFANDGDGYVVNELWVWADNGLALPYGIHIGMMEADLLQTWPELATDFAFEQDDVNPLTGGIADSSRYYQAAEGDLRFCVELLRVDDSYEVCCVWMGPFYENSFDLQAETTSSDAPYSFFGEPMTISRSEDGEWIEIESYITIWHDVDGVWQPCELTDHDVWRMEGDVFRQVAWDTNPAKLLETLLSIEELKPLSCGTGTARYLMDFHNSTVVGIFDADESGYIYRLEDRDAFALALAEGRLDPEAFTLTRIQGAVFPEGVWSLLEELTG